ncbi:MAG: hypothetical protein JHC28_02385 [Thermoprotei archaeon]|nr:hypothetical protein [Thermoprotei archaeon]
MRKRASKRKVRKVLLLQLIKYDKWFAFYPIKEPHVEKIWYVKQHHKKPGVFIVKKIEKGRVVSVKEIGYHMLGVGDICRLFEQFILAPKMYYRLLTGEDIEVDEINIVDMSKKFKHGFMNCSFFNKLISLN